MDHDVGAKLKAVRQARDLSQRQLAKQCGVANATISQIESNTLNPTVSMLKRVLEGIPMTLSEFFAGDFSDTEQVFFRADELIEIGEAGVSYRQIGTSLHGKAIQLLHECYQPGASTGKHPLQHDGEECGLVLSGRIEVQAGSQRKILGPGEAYIF